MTWLDATEYVYYNWPRICSVYRNHNLVLTHSWLIIRFVARAIRRVSLVVQQLITLPIFSVVRFALSLGFYWDYCLSFSFGHCIIRSSSVCDFWLLLWYLQTSWSKQFTDINCLREKQDLIKVIRFSCILIARWIIAMNKGNNKITELRTILQRESPNS